MVHVSRKKGESFEAFMRRFRNVMKMSGKALQVKKIQFFARPKNKNAMRKSALTRSEMAAQRAYLIKTGKLKEEDIKRR